jgi:hypothetical protein
VQTFPRVIALTGLIGSGKTTAANVLTVEFGYERVRFAGPLKAMLRAIGLEHDYVDGDKKETPHPLLCHRTPRHAMQTLGTEWGRNCIGPDFWVQAWLKAIEGKNRVVVDDCRFPNEGVAVRMLGGKVWHVIRPDVSQQQAHASEGQPMPHDRILVNDHDQAYFRQLVIDTFIDVSGVCESLAGPMGRP